MNLEWEDDVDGAAPRGTQVGLVLGLWLSGVFAASLGGRLEGGHEGTATMALLGAAVVWPLLYFAMGRCSFVPQALPPAATGGLLLFATAAVLSSVTSPVALLSTGYVMLTLASIFLAMQFNSNLDPEQYEQGLKIFAVVTTSLLAGFAWYDYVPGMRLGNGKGVLNPNTIALVSTSALLAGMAFKTLVLRLMVMGSAAGIIVLTSSRAAAAAAVVGVVLVVWLRLRARRRPVLIFAAIALILVVGLTFAYGDVLYKTVDQFYALSTADRGISSGASGRVTAWRGTWELFLHNPALGVGFRAHEHLLRADTSAHNGYLATLAEVGVIGFLGVLFLVVRGLRLLWDGSREAESGFSQSILFGLCSGYLLLAIFERYFINVGNPTSLLFLVGIMRSGLMAQAEELPSDNSDDEVDIPESGDTLYGHG